MSKSNMMSGSSLLMGDNTIPGVKIHKEVKAVLPQIEEACRKMGLDYYPIIVEFVRYDEMAELASYGGFPVRYPHWKFGMEYEEMRGYEHNQYRISEMVINCLDFYTRILTKNGSKFAGNISVGDIVVVGDSTRNVVGVNKQSLSQTLKISIKGYLKPLICTKNHKWRVLTDSGKIWKKAEFISKDDILLGCDSYFGFLNSPCKMDRCVAVHHQSKVVKLPEYMTLEMAELMGAVIGDGSCGVKGNENDIYITVGKDFIEYKEHVKFLFEKVFCTSVSFQEKDAATEVMLQSQMAVRYFDANGLVAGCTYKEKRIPQCIWDSSSEFRSAFLRGLFDTDGYASDGLGMSAYNPDLISDVQIMLLEMGIKTSAKTIKNGIGVNGDQKFITVLDINGKQNIEKFKERIGFSIKYKQDSLEDLINTEYCRGGGMYVPYIQNSILNFGEKFSINSYNDSSLGRSLNLMKKNLVGINCLNSFVERVLVNSSYDIGFDIVSLIRTPMMEVDSVSSGDIIETFDIALDHEAHDFIANGILSHNTSPCYIYCMDSNTLVDNVDVIAHAIGHNDFFKNNIFFEPTDDNMMNKLANHGTRIRKYMARWGYEVVTEFIDHCLRLDTLIDPNKAWKKKNIKEVVVRDERIYAHPDRLHSKNNYMDEWVNKKDFIENQKSEIKKAEAASFLDLFGGPQKDILGFLKDCAPLKPWQQDIISMLYDEAMYFAPQRATKMINEGWASFCDYHMLCRMGLVSLGQKTEDSGIWHYAEHKMRVLGGKYSQNPYKLGFELFLDIEDRWNKGKFGSEWENCDDMHEKENWNKNLGLGIEKIFEVRKNYNDFLMIQEFFTPEFCEAKKFFEWKRFSNGEYKIVNKDFPSIKKKMLQRYMNGGLPDIRLLDPNHLGKGWMYLEHQWDGRPLLDSYVRETITSLQKIWKNTVVLSSKTKDGDEYCYICNGNNPETNVHVMERSKYESEYF